jgi:hypothetical protein
MNRLLFDFTGFVRSRPKVWARLIAKYSEVIKSKLRLKGRKTLKIYSNICLGGKNIRKEIQKIDRERACQGVSRGTGDGQDADIVEGHALFFAKNNEWTEHASHFEKTKLMGPSKQSSYNY